MIRCATCGAAEAAPWNRGPDYVPRFSRIYVNPEKRLPCAVEDCKRTDAHIACYCASCGRVFCIDMLGERTVVK